MLNIPLMSACDPDILEGHGARFEVKHVNWPAEWPYAPKVEGRIARTDKALWVVWHVNGLGITVRNLQDGGTIWEDSCCEIFLQAPGNDNYYNIEVNAGGHLLVGCGTGRGDRELLPESMRSIIRFGGVAAPVEVADKPVEWSVGTVIPYEAVGLDPKHLPNHLKGNIYKCGDKTAHPHFLSWAPVGTPAPDFHRPEYFGTFNL